jgi:hypothetical protein
LTRTAYTSLLRLALPSSEKSTEEHEHEHEHPRQPSRAPSIRSMRSTHTLRRVPSITPTLPDGAERMLESLRPDEMDDDDEEDEVPAHGVGHNDKTPQFVLAPEVPEDGKAEVQHQEAGSAQPRSSVEGRGWREVA